jgi:type II secretory ATPase GspE/PulE/Tfp pilus assembly ATPase PilB-like protein
MIRAAIQLPPGADVRTLLDSLVSNAIARGVSDIHVEPIADACEIRFREDGLLRTEMSVSSEIGRSVALRLMVLGHLLTYRLDVPQEGRASVHHDGREVELRISIMPTIHGLRAAVRLPTAAAPRELERLGLDEAILRNLYRFARADTGMLIVTGPAGSGKTTTIYALLAYLAAHSPGSSIVSLEDPVERAIPGVTQIEVKPFGQLTYEKALRSILRQDPQILMLGEIRDAATAQLALQAAMTGHRLITTLHASTAPGAIARLLEMGVESYQVTNAVWGVLGQRLFRKIVPTGLPLQRQAFPPPLPSPVRLRSPQAGVTGERENSSQRYAGRAAIGELLLMDGDLRRVILSGGDLARLEEVAELQPGFVPMRQRVEQLIAQGLTDQNEFDRVFGG